MPALEQCKGTLIPNSNPDQGRVQAEAEANLPRPIWAAGQAT